MRTYRFVLAACIILIVATLILPFYVASRIPSSFIMWGSIISLLLPATAITILLILLPRVPFLPLAAIAALMTLAFIAGILLSQFGLLELVLYLIGVAAVLVASWARPDQSSPSTQKVV
jgi:hypothetical protein